MTMLLIKFKNCYSTYVLKFLIKLIRLIYLHVQEYKCLWAIIDVACSPVFNNNHNFNLYIFFLFCIKNSLTFMDIILNKLQIKIQDMFVTCTGTWIANSALKHYKQVAWLNTSIASLNVIIHYNPFPLTNVLQWFFLLVLLRCRNYWWSKLIILFQVSNFFVSRECKKKCYKFIRNNL